MTDEELADLFRMATAGLIIRAWNKRRRRTSSVTDELSCYSETDPKIVMRTGLFAKSRKICRLYGTEKYCMANSLKKRGNDLELLMHALDGLTRREDTKATRLNARDCVKLGDAFFALVNDHLKT
jgi:hypothetical protein